MTVSCILYLRMALIMYGVLRCVYDDVIDHVYKGGCYRVYDGDFNRIQNALHCVYDDGLNYVYTVDCYRVYDDGSNRVYNGVLHYVYVTLCTVAVIVFIMVYTVYDDVIYCVYDGVLQRIYDDSLYRV